MNPIYFPFTYISRPIIDRLNFFFRRITVYQPCASAIPDDLKALEADGVLDIQCPLQGAGKKLEAALKAHNAWAGVHQGMDKAFLKTGGNWPPFFTDTSASQIKKEIRETAGPMVPGVSASNEGETLFNAGLFLLMAEQMDRQNDQSTACLETAGSMERHLFEQLRGDAEAGIPDPTAGGLASKERLRDYMIPQRLTAFARLVKHTAEISGLYVTDSRSVMDYLLEKSPHMEIISTPATGVPAENEKISRLSRQEQLAAHLEMLVTAPGPLPDDQVAGPALQNETVRPKGRLTLYRALHRSPRAFFAECAAVQDSGAGPDRDDKGMFNHTLIGFVEY